SDVLSCAARARLHVSVHHFHFHRWKRVIDKADVFLSEFATIDQSSSSAQSGSRLGTRGTERSSRNTPSTAPFPEDEKSAKTRANDIRSYRSISTCLDDKKNRLELAPVFIVT